MRRKDRAVQDAEGLRDILTQADACHLALVDDGEPYLVTLSYGFEWQGEWPVLYFHSAPAGRKIDVLKAHPRVCFSVDTDHTLVKGAQSCDWGMKYRSVVGYGTVEFVTEDEDRRRGLDVLMGHYAGPGPFDYGRVLAATTVLKLTVDRMEGKAKD